MVALMLLIIREHVQKERRYRQTVKYFKLRVVPHILLKLANSDPQAAETLWLLYTHPPRAGASLSEPPILRKAHHEHSSTFTRL